MITTYTEYFQSDSMNFQLSQILKQFALNFADLYHKYKISTDKLYTPKYYICSSLEYFKETGLIQLAHTDKPGDLLPPMSIKEIKSAFDLLLGLHPIDVNSINDLYYISKNKISSLVIQENKILVVAQNGEKSEYDLDADFDKELLISKRVSFLIGYIQAEKLMKEAYSVNSVKYRIVEDHISTLYVEDIETKKYFLKAPLDILFSDDYKYFSKEDISRVAYICGQISQI